MIVPNLMVTDMAASVAFYRTHFGMTVTMLISADREMLDPDRATDAVFATLDWDGHMLMLQTAESLSGELPELAAGPPQTPGGTIYFRGLDPDRVAPDIGPDRIVKGPLRQWYGMREIYVRDPDGHILCAGIMDGEPDM